MPPFADADRADRFAGCLVGQAIGDALGFVVEGCGPAVCAAHVESIVHGGMATDAAMTAARDGFAAGQYSDDTQLARELAESLVARAGFDAADYAARIAAAFAADRIVGGGASTRGAAMQLVAGVPWHAAGTPAPSAGNGSAMRVAPIGLWFADDFASLCRAAAEQSRITHADPRCLAGAIAVAGAVAGALRGQLGNAATLCGTLAAAVRPLDGILADGLLAMPGWLAWPAAEVAGRVAPHGVPPLVTPSVLWSLHAALRHPRDHLAAVGAAIAVGGDVDTTAAMTGAIVGAAVGLRALPQTLARWVHDRHACGYDALVALTGALHRAWERRAPS